VKRKILLKSLPILLILALISTSSIGCGTGFESLALELLEEWADAHDVNPSTAGGAVNLAKRAASGSTGDEDADAAIGLVQTVRDIQEGDKLMDEGRELRTKGKPDEAEQKMDEAIKKRPDDWTYRISRSVLSFEQDDFYGGRGDFSAGQAAAGHQPVSVWDKEDEEYRTTVEHRNPEEEMRFYTQYIDEAESSTVDTGKMSRRAKEEYYSTLASAYSWRWLVGINTSGYTTAQRDYDRQMAEHYKEQARQASY
jgi:hypothetical protein